MAVQAVERSEDREPWNPEEARAFVRHVESLFAPWNVDALVEGFTEDCVVRFGTVAQFEGRASLRAFFMAKDYRLRKQFRSLMNDVITNVWEGEWEDVETHRRMRGFGVEVWRMRGGKIAVWEAAFNSGPADQLVDVGRMLS